LIARKGLLRLGSIFAAKLPTITNGAIQLDQGVYLGYWFNTLLHQLINAVD